MVRKFALLIITLTLVKNTVQSQPAIQWQKSYGGSGGDLAKSIIPTRDGGYIIAGHTASYNADITFNHGPDDCWIVKVNSMGSIEWQKSYGGSFWDEGVSIKQTPDNGYIMLGNSQSWDGDVTGHHGTSFLRNDYWVVKLTNTGDLQWEKSLGGEGDEFARSIQLTMDGGYIVAGWSNSTDGDVTGNHGGYDYWIVKLSGTGEVQWEKSLGGSDDDIALDIQQTPDNGYIVAGGAMSTNGDVTGNHGRYDYWIVKLDSNGNIISQKSYGGGNDELAFSIQLTTDGGLIIAGRSASFNGDVSSNKGNEDYWIVKLSSTGDIEWQKSFGGNANDNAYTVQQASDGGYIVGGYTESFTGDVTGNHYYLSADEWILKFSSTGDLQWQKYLGGRGSEYAQQIQETADKGYIIAGSSYSNDADVSGNHGDYDYWIVKLGPDAVLPLQLTDFGAKQSGNAITCQWQTLQEQNVAKFIVEYSKDGTTFSEIGTVYATGNNAATKKYSFTHYSPAVGNNYYKLRMVDKDGSFTYSKIVNVFFGNQQLSLKVYPNPATTYVVVEHPASSTSAQLQLLDANGSIVKNKVAGEGATQTTVNVRNLASGVYTVIWTNGVDKKTKTVMVK